MRFFAISASIKTKTNFVDRNAIFAGNASHLRTPTPLLIVCDEEKVLTHVSAFFFARGPVLLHRGAIINKVSRVKASNRGCCQKTTHKHDTII